MAIKSSAGAAPEFCHPACNESNPCGGKVCPYPKEVKNRRKASGRQSEITSTEVDGTKGSSQSSSIRKGRGSATPVNDVPPDKETEQDELLDSNNNRDQINSKGENELKESYATILQGITKANGVFDWRFMCGILIGIIFVLVLILLVLAILYAARKVILVE